MVKSIWIRTVSLLCILGIGLSFCACSGTRRSASMSLSAFGTILYFTLYGPDSQTIEKLGQDLRKECERLETVFSFELDDSDLSRLNLSEGPVEVPSEMIDVLKIALDVGQKSGGALDVTIGSLIELWHIETNPGVVPDEKDIQTALAHHGMDRIVIDEAQRTVSRTDSDMLIHLGAVAKGYLGYRLRQIVLDHGCSGVLNLGGNLQLCGSKDGANAKWRVGIADPFSPEDVFAELTIGDAAVVTSGAYARFFELNGVRYHHILDPETGYPSESDIASATVLGPDGAVCDALSTACFILGKDEAINLIAAYPAYSYLLILQDGSVEATDGMEVFIHE